MMIINTRAMKKEQFIDLASLLEDKSHITYVCNECGTDLILDAEYQIKNPFSRGSGYFCGSCQKTFDDSLVRLVKKPRAVSSIIGDKNDLLFQPIPGDKEGSDLIEDEYSKYDSQFDGDADQFLINSGSTILRSEITLIDSSGRNRVLVRRDDND
jgi:hypothetical protein